MNLFYYLPQKHMKFHRIAFPLLVGLPLASFADVQCWAPHMGNPSGMATNSLTSYAGKPYRYIIKGFQGWICLGSTDSSATVDGDGNFRKNANGNGPTMTSTSFVTVAVNGKSIPLTLSVTGSKAGTGTGLVVQNLATPVTIDNPKGDPMNFVFTRTGTNTASYGVFYVVGEYILDDPLKGTMTVPRTYMIRGTTAQEGGTATQQAVSTPVTYSIERKPQVISPPLPPLNPPTGNVTPTTSSGSNHDNGHGNNVDGVDSSNPGAPKLDPSSGSDDETKFKDTATKTKK